MFGLKKDPFGTYDYTLEQESGEQYPRIKTPAVQVILNLAKSGTNVILAGPKGAGKTTAMGEASKELGKECLAMVGFRTITDIYNYLWLEIWRNHRKSLEEIKSRFQLGELRQLPQWFKGERCGYRLCPRGKLRAKCLLNTKGEDMGETYYDSRLKKEVAVPYRTFEKICEELHYIQIRCPMKRFIVNELLKSKLKHFRNKVYLLDIHDDLLNFKRDYDLSMIDELLNIFQSLGNVVITSTNEQCTKLKKSEAIARIKVMKFPLPTEEDLKEIYEKRVKMVQTPNVNSLLFTEEGVETLIRWSHRVVRVFLQKCSDVYFGMVMEGREEPADREFVLKVLKNAVMSETDAIELMVTELKDEKRGWVKVRDLVEMLRTKYNVDVGERRLGRRLMNEWKLPQRNNDGSEYKFD